MKIIGITGKARSGKDTIARHMWSNYAFMRIAFADPLKRAAQSAFGLTSHETYNEELKEVVIARWGLSPRQIFQHVGDLFKAQYGDDFWVKRWLIGYDLFKDTDDIVVPDVRFDNEAEMIRRLGGIIIEVRRGPGLVGSTGDHISERGLSTLAEIVIENEGTLQELYSQIDSAIEKWV